MALFCLLTACGGGGKKPAAPATPATREFPMVEIPAMMEDPAERVRYATDRFWDAFTDTTRLYRCDSLTVNGVPMESLEYQTGIFVTLLQQEDVAPALRAVERLYDRIDLFARRYPSSNVFDKMVSLTQKYLYDPNSPVRDEQLYLPFVQRLAASDLVEETQRQRYAWEASLTARNLPGTQAADFAFTDTQGRLRTLYGIRADQTLLVFGNPGCAACQDLMAQMEADPVVSDLVRRGSLKVVDVYIDEEVEDWMAHRAEYPSVWINGYDHLGKIRGELIYNVRAIPSLYLLDKDKKVMLKDAPTERVLAVLSSR